MPEPDSCYRPLNERSREIRLLVLLPQPHPEDNRIQCNLLVSPLNSAPEYEALSYTWGNPDNFNFRVRVDDVLVPVRRNLLCALRVLRGDTERLLWIDALCINQEDSNEKGRQVEIMGKIYRHADQVLAWLGTPHLSEFYTRADVARDPPPLESVLAFELVKKMARFAQKFNMLLGVSNREANRQDSTDWRKAWDLEFIDCNSSPLWHAWIQLAQLCRVNYWGRLWIIQEFFSAKRLKLLYGSDNLDWTEFQIFRRVLLSASKWKSSSLPQEIRSALHDIRYSFPWTLEEIRETGVKRDNYLIMDIASLFNLSKDSRCKDRRDKVYGILGLATDFKEGDISVDYSQSLFDLYCSVMRWRKCLLEKPFGRSWNPIMFSRITQRTLLGVDSEESGPYEMANSRKLVQRHSSIDDMSFELSSWDLGKVLTSSSNPENVLRLAQETWGPMKDSILTTIRHRNNGPPFFFDFDNDPIAGHWRKVLEKAWEWDRDSFVLFNFNENGTPNPNPYSGEANESETGLSIFVTYDMRTGIGPTGIQKGDLVCDFSPEKTEPCTAIVRIHEGIPKVLGRALIPYETVTDPEDYRSIVSSREDIHNSIVRIPNDFCISVEMQILQALTSPLGYLSSDLSELQRQKPARSTQA
jgi:hypothetical protein